MTLKHILAATVLTAISASAFIPAQAVAQVGVSIVIGTPPPPPRYERVPPPRNGYVWAPGYWNWDGHRHVWAGGHWEPVRRGYMYDRPQWRQGHNGWELQRGGWRRGDDRDRHDGRRDDRHDERRDYHCPPGQAKKGNC
ncbi:YXWGXW repeat-containing protein [Herbaspirillum autotrophicum]|uniref:YXWGXW repeat-containing protein n=1 Tax=Herbaspirillum autotrophicum TaxID=180195 RepID=UPI00067D75AC|nr:YXWGXW repeat-containing protein [Herbaspirillum autotrophicum]